MQPQSSSVPRILLPQRPPSALLPPRAQSSKADVVIVGGGPGKPCRSQQARQHGRQADRNGKSFPSSVARVSSPKARSASARSTRRPTASRPPCSRSSTPPSSTITSAPTRPYSAFSAGDLWRDRRDHGHGRRASRHPHRLSGGSPQTIGICSGGAAEVIKRFIENVERRGGEIRRTRTFSPSWKTVSSAALKPSTRRATSSSSMPARSSSPRAGLRGCQGNVAQYVTGSPRSAWSSRYSWQSAVRSATAA